MNKDESVKKPYQAIRSSISNRQATLNARENEYFREVLFNLRCLNMRANIAREGESEIWIWSRLRQMGHQDQPLFKRYRF